ncbi:dynein axonemal intermediate chain 7 isoform X2 [Betta splendens]|uniref:Dynein axonemal intermediate chain 7 n=1 Tax=Betta splendens TaxID=158456 RepID=A0A6P7NH41_BETSP|nr:dynein axonemal intermediate chain 7 isoform X2 [Betta splendens]
MCVRYHGYVNAVGFGRFVMSSKKGSKPNKAQKLKQQREEEERRLREEEEARQAEREEQERQEREIKEKELERLELKDRERRDDELNELRHLLEENHAAVTKWKTDAVEKAKWERYVHCDGTPDPAVVQDINTYISLWRDDPEVDITAVLQQCKRATWLVEELEELLRGATDPQEAEKYQEALINLLELIHFKHQVATEEILKRANESIDTETGNMQTVVKDDNVTLCLWANLKKNPRFKGLNFKEASVGFELPKQLAVSDIAVRILHTRYDHLSLLARMAHQRVYTTSHRSLTGGDAIAVEMDVSINGETKEDEEVMSILESEGQKSAASLQSTRSSAQLAQHQSGQILTQMEALKAEEDVTSPASVVQVVDLMQYTPLGGIFYYDIFCLPPQAYQVNGWEIRQVLNKGLEVFPYPTETTLEDGTTLSSLPIGVSVTLPDSVVFLKPPHVACWDVAGEQWRMDRVTDASHEDAKISFKMDSFHAFVLMQETYANFPIRSWELKPLCQDCVILTVNGALIDVSITIKGDQCMLESQHHKGLTHLTGKWMSAPALQRAVINAGINIFVDEYADKYISTCCKDPLTEHAAYEQMALLASACAFSWSKWNAKCRAEHLVMQVCEHLGPDPVPKDSWSLYLLGAQKSLKLQITETSDSFAPDHYPGSEFHSTFMHMLQDNMSAEGINMTRKSSYLFIDTVQSLLCATKPLMHS